MAIDRDMDLFRSYIEIFNLPPYTDEQIYVNLIIMHMQESYWDIELASHKLRIKRLLRKIDIPVKLMYG